MNDSIIKIKNVRKAFTEGEVKNCVLKGTSFEVKKSEFVSIMGESGCGKSTLLYTIGGLEKVDSGTIVCCGRDVVNSTDKENADMRLNDIGFVFQFNNLVQNLTVKENILLPVIMAGKDVDEFDSYATELMKMMKINDKKDSFPSKLSGGQQQRVALARAVISNPKVILADEPTGNLDSKSGENVLNILKDLNKTKGITIIMVTHSIEAASCADRVVTMKDGVIFEQQ